MISVDKLSKIFSETIDIAPPGQGVLMGLCTFTDSEEGLEAVLSFYCNYIDELLQTLPMDDVQRLELTLSRSFSFAEYHQLFLRNIKETEFTNYAIFRALPFISTNQERLLFIHSHKDTYEAFLDFHHKWTESFNNFLFSHLHEVHT